MSLDVYLHTPITKPADECSCPHCEGHGQVGGETVYDANITHNLGAMAREAGVYAAMWRPDENGMVTAADLIAPLEAGLALLEDDPDRFRAMNPPNGWGSYDGLVRFVRRYLTACRENPTATVVVSR